MSGFSRRDKFLAKMQANQYPRARAGAQSDINSLEKRTMYLYQVQEIII